MAAIIDSKKDGGQGHSDSIQKQRRGILERRLHEYKCTAPDQGHQHQEQMSFNGTRHGIYFKVRELFFGYTPPALNLEHRSAYNRSGSQWGSCDRLPEKVQFRFKFYTATFPAV